MNKKYYLWMVLSIVLSLFASCSSDDNLGDSKATVDVSKDLTFPVTFADYNEEITTGNGKTRAVSNSSDTISHDFVNMDNGIVADVTLQRDNMKQAPKSAAAMTRSIGDGTYTMLAYQGGVLKGEVEGTITSGMFTPNAGGNKSISLNPGNYDFVLYSSGFFTRSGNNLTITSASENAMIGRVDNYVITATPQKQQVPFVMRHAVSRVRVRVTAYDDRNTMHIGYISFSAANNNEIPTEATYDLANDSWSSSGSKTAIGIFPSMGSSWSKVKDGNIVRFTSPNYTYFMPGANITKVNAVAFSGGSYLQLYREDVTGKTLGISLSPVLKTEPNGSYLINVTFRKNFLYLMSDGTTGLLSETIYGGGTKIPIGVVVSQSKKLAAALDFSIASSQTSSHNPLDANFHINDQYAEFPTRDGSMKYIPTNDDGYKYTWEATGSADGVTIKGNSNAYPEFYTAGHYTPSLPAGKTLSGSIVGKKWFLPSLTELSIFSYGPGINNINFSLDRINGYGVLIDDEPSVKMSNQSSNLNTVDLAFIQVGGTVPDRRDLGWGFVTSTAVEDSHGSTSALAAIRLNILYTFAAARLSTFVVRPFIKY